jgi:hypothetical protein
VNKIPAKITYVYTSFGANNDAARDYIANKLGPQRATLVEGQEGEKGMQVHMRTNTAAVGMLQSERSPASDDNPNRALRERRTSFGVINGQALQTSVVGIELGCVCFRQRATILTLSVARWVHNSAMATFSGAPYNAGRPNFQVRSEAWASRPLAFPSATSFKRWFAHAPTSNGLLTASFPLRRTAHVGSGCDCVPATTQTQSARHRDRQSDSFRQPELITPRLIQRRPDAPKCSVYLTTFRLDIKS